MRIVLFTNLLPAASMLANVLHEGRLKAIVCTDKVREGHTQLNQLCDDNNIVLLQVDSTTLSTQVRQLMQTIQPDAAIMIGFSYRIPAHIFNTPPLGFYNVHFSLLPAYRGPDPLFHQLKNGEHTGGITIHKVDEYFDNGDIVMQHPMPIIPGETWGICFNRLLPVAADMVTQLLLKLKQNTVIKATSQSSIRATYYSSITIADITVNWKKQTAEEIDNLVNACNPASGGALTFFKNQPVRLIEVSQVDGEHYYDCPSGTIVHAGSDGLFVYCLSGQLLRINIVSVNEGVISGAKFASLGVSPGSLFETLTLMQPA